MAKKQEEKTRSFLLGENVVLIYYFTKKDFDKGGYKIETQEDISEEILVREIKKQLEMEPGVRPIEIVKKVVKDLTGFKFLSSMFSIKGKTIHESELAKRCLSILREEIGFQKRTIGQQERKEKEKKTRADDQYFAHRKSLENKRVRRNARRSK